MSQHKIFSNKQTQNKNSIYLAQKSTEFSSYSLAGSCYVISFRLARWFGWSWWAQSGSWLLTNLGWLGWDRLPTRVGMALFSYFPSLLTPGSPSSLAQACACGNHRSVWEKAETCKNFFPASLCFMVTKILLATESHWMDPEWDWKKHYKFIQQSV